MLTPINKSLDSLLERQIQMYLNMNTQLRKDSSIVTVSIMQPEPLCDVWQSNKCVACPVQSKLGRNCAKRGFFNLPNYVGNEDLIRVTDHALEVFTAIQEGTRIPKELGTQSANMDADNNAYWSYA